MAIQRILLAILALSPRSFQALAMSVQISGILSEGL
jgi:hypothetical protein